MSGYYDPYLPDTGMPLTPQQQTNAQTLGWLGAASNLANMSAPHFASQGPQASILQLLAGGLGGYGAGVKGYYADMAQGADSQMKQQQLTGMANMQKILAGQYAAPSTAPTDPSAATQMTPTVTNAPTMQSSDGVPQVPMSLLTAPNGSTSPSTSIPSPPSPTDGSLASFYGNPASAQPAGAPVAPQGSPTPMLDPRTALQLKLAALASGNKVPEGLGSDLAKDEYVGRDGKVYQMQGGQSDPSYIHSAAMAKAGPEALTSLLGQAGRVDHLAPGEVARTGFDTLPPELKAAAMQLIGGGQGAPAGPGAAYQGAAAALPVQQASTSDNSGIALPGPNPNAPRDSTGFPYQPTSAPGGGIQSPMSLEGAAFQKEVLPAQFKKAGEDYQAAQGILGNLDYMDNSLETMNKSGYFSTGAGAKTRIEAAKGINTIAQVLGAPPIANPDKIASAEEFNKQTTNMGFNLAKTLGSREAQMIVQQATNSVPSMNNTYLGGRLVSSSLRQGAQRQMDYYEFMQDYAQGHDGNTMGADVAFNKANPISNYVTTAQVNAIPEISRTRLMQDPSLSDMFDKTYGSGMAKKVLGSNGR